MDKKKTKITKTAPLITPLMPVKDSTLIYNTIDCPIPLYNRIVSLDLSRINKEYLFRFIGIILYELFNEGHDKNEFYKVMDKSYRDKIATSHFRKKVWPSICFNFRHLDINRVSLGNSIIQTDGVFSRTLANRKERPLAFRINPQLISENTVPLIYSLTNKDDSLNYLFPEIIEHFKQSYSALTLNINLLLRNAGEELQIYPIGVGKDFCLIARNYDEAEKLSKIEAIPSTYIAKASVIGQNNITNTSTDFLIKKLYEVREKLANKIEDADNIVRIIIDGKTISIDNFISYSEEREAKAYKQYKFKAKQIQNKQGDFKISSVNGRFFTPLTELNRIGLKYLKINDSNLTSFDLKTSQITILTNLMVGSNSFIQSIKNSRIPKLKVFMDAYQQIDSSKYKTTEFLDYLLTEDIYADLASDIGSIRQIAKVEVFKFLFTEPQAKITNYKIKQGFPDFFSFLKEIKEHFRATFGNSKTSLAHFLQLIEAHVFLECILTEIANNNIAAFTKHDSIIINSQKNNVDKVDSIIKKVTLKIGFQGDFKTEQYDVTDHSENPIFYNSPEWNLLSSMPTQYSGRKDDFQL